MPPVPWTSIGPAQAADPSIPTIRITGTGRSLEILPILGLAALGYILTGRRALGFGIGAALGVWAQTSGALDAVRGMFGGGRFAPGAGAGRSF